eukprot:scaffold426_cov219-Amphora_coffeaeformis.AAC.56
MGMQLPSSSSSSFVVVHWPPFYSKDSSYTPRNQYPTAPNNLVCATVPINPVPLLRVSSSLSESSVPSQ